MTGVSNISSKLPKHETSIFSVMSKMAFEHDAVNLSQGYPNFETDQKLKDLVAQAMNDGYNQYAPLAGIKQLREQIIDKIEKLHGKRYDENKEITVTNGATQALFLAITAFVNPGDEVIVLKPAYDSYEPAIKLNGGIPVLLQLEGKGYKLNIEEIKQKITSKTRMLIINTPHNPSGNVFSKEEMQQLEALLEDTNIILLSDEVYEHIVFDEARHYSASAFPNLSKRAIICASFGKTFHNTGWKMGYCVAPEELMAEIWKVMEVNVFCVHHPTQRAFAEYLQSPEHYLDLGRFYQEKRDRFLDLIKDSAFKAVPSKGTYFQLLDYSEITNEPDVDFSRRLIKEFGIASIPVSVFNKDQIDHRQLRFCFAKTNQTLEKAAEILNRIK
ncbi:aminotransferase class I/II-fold pyridoxal phosphate-dependent enzyme [Salinimicrobium tongyeongense]|uniref:Aminotransferase class I/II-fold pyridoxal phosphate-dependent enzyme n=1 Tax=Salinimicrobium tongyeongense TaxID=2809707 RepID=A0ABY6NU64_9FLAO|nr:methionine aminotransferase [Salinimicrobium tongyeongense]UZH56445.1 aminotransferase class I/II-fold pyridoxal phosphate-dependent enzyme [Salinimicrobium tongyeongense]